MQPPRQRVTVEKSNRRRQDVARTKATSLIVSDVHQPAADIRQAVDSARDLGCFHQAARAPTQIHVERIRARLVRLHRLVRASRQRRAPRRCLCPPRTLVRGNHRQLRSLPPSNRGIRAPAGGELADQAPPETIASGSTSASTPPGLTLTWARSMKFDARPALPWPTGCLRRWRTPFNTSDIRRCSSSLVANPANDGTGTPIDADS